MCSLQFIAPRHFLPGRRVHPGQFSGTIGSTRGHTIRNHIVRPLHLPIRPIPLIRLAAGVPAAAMEATVAAEVLAEATAEQAMAVAGTEQQ